MHEKLITLVEDAGGEIEGIVFCPHLPETGCDCRKPRVGLLTEIESTFGLSLAGEPFVGDSLRDLEAAIAFGCRYWNKNDSCRKKYSKSYCFKRYFCRKLKK